MINISDSDSDSNIPVTMETDPVFEVERILDHRRSHANEKVVEYKIKWKGYDNKYNTWENEKNIFSKGLIIEYWKTKPYSLADFRNKTHSKKNVAKSLERKQLEKEIREAKVVATPPAGLVWTDIEVITNVFFTEPNIYFAEVKWRDNPKSTFIPTRIIKKHNPLKLLQYYETKLDFYIPQNKS